MVATLVDGIPTMAGWLNYASDVAFMGAFGGLAFWTTWRGMEPDKRLAKPGGMHGPGIR